MEQNEIESKEKKEYVDGSRVKTEYAEKLGLSTVKRSKIRKRKRKFASVEQVDKEKRKKGKKRKVKKIEKLSTNTEKDSGTQTVLITKRVPKGTPKTPWQKARSIMSYGVVCIFAVIFGFVAGNMYIQATFSPTYDFIESDYRYSSLELQAILSANKNVSTTNALHAFVIAEENIKKAEYYRAETPKGSSYTAPSIAPVQTIYSLREKNGNKYDYLTITEGIMSVAEKIITTDGGQNFNIWRTKSVKNGEPVFGNDPSFVMTYDETRAEYGTDAMNPVPYVVSNKTIHESYGADPSATGLGTLDENGNYKFTLKLNTNESVMNYVKQMKHMSELGSYPSFAFITIEFVLDSEFRFVSLHITEKYTVTYFGVPASCNAEMYQEFTY